MKRIILFFIAVLVTFSIFADDPKTKVDGPTFATNREFKSRVFEIHNRDPHSVQNALTLLGSGFQGAGMSVNEELRTLTVRDFPENIAAIDEAIKRLDQPVAADPQIELHLYVLIGSNEASAQHPVPAELTDVVKQLQSTLRYSSYGLMTSGVHRTRPGRGVEGSGVAETRLLGMTAQPDGKPILYSYKLRGITVHPSGDREAIDIDSFDFQMRVPIGIGAQAQYQSVGFETPVTVRAGEKIVVGTTSMGDKALIVVVTATVSRNVP